MPLLRFKTKTMGAPSHNLRGAIDIVKDLEHEFEAVLSYIEAIDSGIRMMTPGSKQQALRSLDLAIQNAKAATAKMQQARTLLVTHLTKKGLL